MLPEGETVTIIRDVPGGVDQYGDPIEGSEITFKLGGCAVGPRRETGFDETDERSRQGVIVGLRVFAPTGSDVRRTDKAKVRGQTYEVDGEPTDWHSPYTGEGRGVEFTLKRPEG